MISRYVNMDYIVLSTLKHSDVKIYLFTYDIACQWHKHLPRLILSFLSDMHIDMSNIRL